MHFTNLEVRNFSGVSKKIDGLLPMTLLTGKNGSGKTTMLRAARLLLGMDVQIDGKRVPWDGWLTGDEARIEGTLVHRDAEHDMSLVITRSGAKYSVDGTPMGRTEFDAFFAGIDVQRGALNASLAPELTLSTTLPELLCAMSGGTTKDALADWCGDNWPWLESFLSRKRRKPPRTSAEFGELGKALDEERKELNREIKTLTELTKSIGKPEPPVAGNGRLLTVKDRQEVADSLLTLEAKRDEAMKKLGAMTAYQQNMDALAAMQKELDGITFPTEAELKAAAAAVREYERASKLESDLRACAARLEAVQSRACPTCGQDIEPDAGLVKTLEDALSRAQAAAEGIDHAAIGEAHSRAVELRSEFQKAQNRADSIRSRMAMLRKDMPDQFQNPSELDAEINKMADRIERGRQIIKTLDTLELREKNLSTIAARSAEVEKLTWGIAAFRDGAAESELLTDGRAAVLEIMKAVLRPIGYDIRISGYVVEGRRGDELWRPVSRMSSGENVFLQGCVGAAFGGLCTVDNIDHLDSWFKPAFLRVVRKATATGWLLAGAWGNGQDGEEKAVKIAEALGAAVIWME